MRALLLLVAACTPSPDQIGETLWRRPSTDLATFGTVGPAGHLVRGITSLEVLYPDGTLAWTVPCNSTCGIRQAVDADGNVFAATARADTITLTRFSALDGSVAWSHTIEAVSSRVALDATGVVWWFVGSQVAVDFGGGPLTGRVFGRFRASDGTYVSSGTMDFFIDSTTQPHPLPDGGLLVIDPSDRGLVEIDANGAIRSRFSRDVYMFAPHESGELTLLEFVAVDESAGEQRSDIVRLDAAHGERWRRRSVGSAEFITPIAGGRALIAGSDSLAGSRSSDASVLSLVDEDGSLHREILDAAQLILYTGSSLDGFRFFEGNFLEGGVVARSAP